MLAGTADAHLGLDFVYLCCELGVSWSTLDPRELCGMSHVNASACLWPGYAMDSRAPRCFEEGKGKAHTHLPRRPSLPLLAPCCAPQASLFPLQET